MDYRTQSIFEADTLTKMIEGLKLAQCMKMDVESMQEQDLQPEQDERKLTDELCISGTLFCSFCKVAFEDKAQQRLHYKLDWHRYNLKQNLMGCPLVSEEEFHQLADDVSSISGSETSSEDEDDDASPDKDASYVGNKQKESARYHKLQVERHSKVFFENSDGKILSVYRCILHDKKNPLEDSELVNALLRSVNKSNWAIIMLGGGHFAAAVYNGSEPVVHKTFHSYTVRARQGGAQSSRDGRSGGSHPKSSGASLRRYNEASFNQHVQEILIEWAKHIESCSLILCRAVGHNRHILFGGRNPPLDKNDARVRSVPIPTRRATFNEVQRIHKMLSNVEVYGCASDVQTPFRQSPKKSSPERLKKLNEDLSAGDKETETKQGEKSSRSPRHKSKIDRAKGRPSPQRTIPGIEISAADTLPQSSDEGETILVSCNDEMSYSEDLQEFKDSLSRTERKKTKPKVKKEGVEKKPNRSSQPKEKVREAVINLREKLIAACKLSNLPLLEECLKSCNTNNEDLNVQNNSKKVTPEELVKCLNEIISGNGSTLLHIAAENGNTSIIRTLLEAGCDPSLKNKKSQAPFAVSADRETRNIFRKFMAEYPERYDYKKSQIPGPLTDDMEQMLLERRKEVKKAKRDREKEKKKEETDMDRFLKLSDREKRALAAERRILANNAQGKSDIRVVSRCFECAADITGKVPFEYDIHRFCTMDCLKKHRQKLKTQCQQK